MTTRIGLLTSGGDAPGMNAAIRATTRTALANDMEVLGIKKGFEGLMEGHLSPISARDVGGILEKSGTMLSSSRTEKFQTEEGQAQALKTIQEEDITALVIIGGNGSQKGAYALQKHGIPVVGIAATIDNDIYGSDIAIGVDSALHVAVRAIDQLRATMSSLHRCSIVEVMGRNHGYLAQQTGIAGGAEAIVIPETETNPDTLADIIEDAHQREKRHALIVVAEGAHYHAEELEHYLKNLDRDLGFEIRTTILGHIQRGGTPTPFDRILASKLGYLSAHSIADHSYGVVACWKNGKPCLQSLENVAMNEPTLDLDQMDLASTLAR